MKKNDPPAWFEKKYPSLEDLERSLECCGCRVTHAEIGDEALFVAGDGHEPHVVILPAAAEGLRRAWLLAHELAHLLMHRGYASGWTRSQQEARANAWAARALIPEAAVRRHRNASMDAFIAALSAHYEDLPSEDCPQRRLAAEIAHIRLKAVEEVA